MDVSAQKEKDRGFIITLPFCSLQKLHVLGYSLIKESDFYYSVYWFKN